MLRAGWPRRRHGAGCPVCWGTEGGPAGGQPGAGRVDGEQGRQPRRGSCRAPSARPSPPSLPPCLPSGARSALGVHLCTPALSPTGTRRAWQPRAHTWEVRSRCQCVSHGRPGEEGTRCRAGTAAPGPGTGASAAVGGRPGAAGPGAATSAGSLPPACPRRPLLIREVVAVTAAAGWSCFPNTGGARAGRPGTSVLETPAPREHRLSPSHTRGDVGAPGLDTSPWVGRAHVGSMVPGPHSLGRAKPTRCAHARDQGFWGMGWGLGQALPADGDSSCLSR